MKRYTTLFFAFFLILPLTAQNGLKERLGRHVYTLAADSLLGRNAGSADSRRAADYIIKNFEEIGLQPFVGDTTYKQKFSIGSGTKVYTNIIGCIPGSDPALSDEYIIIGAHYDHLGYKMRGRDTIIYNGADDNASGTAAMLEIARMMKARENELKRTVVFAAFDAEEIGLYGSTHMASLLPLDRVAFMASVDMVGWLRAEGRLKVAGVGMLRGGRNIMETIPCPEGLDVRFKKYDRMMMGGSDHDPFAQKGVPAFYVTTGLKSPYHKPEDTAEKIDYDGMVLVTEYLAGMTLELAGNDRLAASGRVSPKHKYPTVEFAVTASVGSNRHRYKEGALNGKTAFAWNGGFFMQVNMGFLALRPELLYQYRSAQHPGGAGWADAPSERLSLHSATIPVNLLVKYPKESPMYFYINAGGYYSWNLGGNMDDRSLDFNNEATRHEWGWTWGLGAAMGPVGISFTSFNGITPLLREGPVMKNSTAYFTLYYRF